MDGKQYRNLQKLEDVFTRIIELKESSSPEVSALICNKDCHYSEAWWLLRRNSGDSGLTLEEIKRKIMFGFRGDIIIEYLVDSGRFKVGEDGMDDIRCPLIGSMDAIKNGFKYEFGIGEGFDLHPTEAGQDFYYVDRAKSLEDLKRALRYIKECLSEYRGEKKAQQKAAYSYCTVSASRR